MGFDLQGLGKVAMGAGALGLAGKYLGGGSSGLNQNFSFGTPESRTNQYNANPDLIASVGNLNQQGDMFNNMSNTYQQQYGQMIDPNSSYNAGLYGQASSGIQDMGAQRFQQQNQAIASRGGPASMASLLGAVGQSNDANSYANAVRSISNSSLQQAQGFGNMAINAGQAGTQAFGQAGQFNAGIDANTLQNNQNNMQSENQYNQYLKTSAYNQDVQNQNTKTDRQGNLLSAVGGVAGAVAGTALSAKTMFICIPEGTEIDTPDGQVEIQELKAGDKVIGFNGKSVSIEQKHEYKENPNVKRFLELTFDDGSIVNLCDMHRLNDVRSKYLAVGNIINQKTIVNIDWYDGVKRSYDLLTEDKGYQISNIPVNSMIEEMAKFANFAFPKINYSGYNTNINEVA